tara:strand:- start:6890 stop:7141 length:252 start_codon:yes stop_codon:yes gene_type:complete
LEKEQFVFYCSKSWLVIKLKGIAFQTIPFFNQNIQYLPYHIIEKPFRRIFIVGVNELNFNLARPKAKEASKEASNVERYFLFK